MSEWKTIDSAPKDGTIVDIWTPEYGRLTDYKRVELSKNNEFYDPVRSGVTTVRDATHWMPLPPPPKDAK